MYDDSTVYYTKDHVLLIKKRLGNDQAFLLGHTPLCLNHIFNTECISYVTLQKASKGGYISGQDVLLLQVC